MTRTTRALVAFVPTTTLVLSVVFASAALAPEAMTAPEAVSTPTAASPAEDAAATADPSVPDAGSGASDRRSSSPSPADPVEPAQPTTGSSSADRPATDPPAADRPADSPSATPPDAADPLTGENPVRTPPLLHDLDGVDVDVDITPPAQPGSLSLSVAADAVDLAESGSTALQRRFTGGLPTVTVTDSRVAAQNDWYVLASASALTGPSASIGADHLGWTPRLVAGTGAVAGDPVVSSLEGGAGLRDALLLGADGGVGTWSADAELRLLAEPNVEAGSYRSTITLSLFA
ncbi:MULTISPECIES: hypothetical protein [unclassified Rathayibacter]|uniref:hypothetical protein n=1 Tax=unclassified Rathayibacter TaxID=2609250 RepID=UPI000CE85DDB|nr:MULTISPECIES: hypothetical protein [unclassified Rathayibacter]PPG09373.1 hypothetical protein C5C26_06395 [Rathayibacter sp. AY2B1]PPG67942.1 hypothetical protein C5C59_13670 [Rathayibacter sp. AY1F4]